MNMLLFNNSVQFDIMYRARNSVVFPSLKKLSKKKKFNTTCDVVYKLNGLFSLLEGEAIDTYLEPMAGIGFSSGLMEVMFNPVMILNDILELCYDHLKKRFPNQTVYNRNCKEKDFVQQLPTVDCCFLDPNRNLFKRNKAILLLYLNKATTVLICSDSLPFPWHLAFDEAKFKNYLVFINKMVRVAGWFIRGVYLYPHKRVMIVKLKKHKGEMRMVPCGDPFTLERIKSRGLFCRKYYGLL